MKRQLNFWANKRGYSKDELVNVSLSIEDNKRFTAIFRRPGSAKPIAQVVSDINIEDVYNLTYAFESSGCLTFHDEMDERIYFGNIARQKEDVKRAENLGVCTSWSTILYIVLMIVGVYFCKLSVPLTLCLSTFISISFCFWLKKNIYNETKTSNDS